MTTGTFVYNGITYTWRAELAETDFGPENKVVFTWNDPDPRTETWQETMSIKAIISQFKEGIDLAAQDAAEYRNEQDIMAENERMTLEEIAMYHNCRTVQEFIDTHGHEHPDYKAEWEAKELFDRIVIEADMIHTSHHYAADMDKGFDAGEFSGPAHENLAEKKVKALCDKHGIDVMKVDEEMKRRWHEAMIQQMADDGPYGRIV